MAILAGLKSFNEIWMQLVYAYVYSKQMNNLIVLRYHT